MSNLYTVDQPAEDVALVFGVMNPVEVETPEETRPGLKGLIVRKGERGRTVHSLTWGFPRRDRETGTLKPVNLVADLTNPMWSEMAQDPRYRCLIAVSAFANPAGKRGAMTRTWFRLKREPVFAWAGFCRQTKEWGAVFAGMTCDANPMIEPLNPRMPVILRPHEHEDWLTCKIDRVIDLQYRGHYPADEMEAIPTKDPWVQRRAV